MQNRISQHLWKAAWEHYVISFHISSFSQALIFLIDTALGGKKNIKDKHVVNVMIRYWKSSAGAAMWWSDVELNNSSKATKTLSVFKNNLNFYSARLKNKPTPSKKGKIMRRKFSKKVKLHWRKVTHRWLNISRDLFYATTLRDVQMNIIRSGRRLSPTNTRTTPGDSAPRGRGVLTPPQTLTEQVT